MAIDFATDAKYWYLVPMAFISICPNLVSISNKTDSHSGIKQLECLTSLSALVAHEEGRTNNYLCKKTQLCLASLDQTHVLKITEKTTWASSGTHVLVQVPGCMMAEKLKDWFSSKSGAYKIEWEWQVDLGRLLVSSIVDKTRQDL